MKGYVYVYDKRSAILKKLLIEKGYEIVDDINDDFDFCFLKDQIVDCKYSFSLSSNNSKYVMNNNYLFRHFNNLLTAMGTMIMILDRNNVSNILIIGYGDLAKQLANLLKTYKITIANRNKKEYNEIIKYYRHVDIDDLKGKYDVIINTVPLRKIDYNKLEYDIIFDLANSLELDNYLSIRNVPELYFPDESALLMLNYILDVINNV